jgi:hypothetical protein
MNYSTTMDDTSVTASSDTKDREIVNRIPPSTAKKTNESKVKRSFNFQVDNSATASKKHKAALSPLETSYPPLDSTDPEDIHRMDQRRKQIVKGKNTVGYSEYVKQVPKEQRLARSMATPMTPDASLKIPNKRWNGLVKAW